MATTKATPKRKPVAKKTTTRKPAVRKPPVPVVETPLTADQLTAEQELHMDGRVYETEVTEEERQALLTAYNALTYAGLPIPPEIFEQVEGWIAEENARREAEEAEREAYREALAEENRVGPWYVRNGYTAPFSLRLDRQTEKRRIELKPRGMSGDMHPLEDGDLKDPILKRNISIGCCEIIPAGEANRILDRQNTNMGERVHTPTAILRNAKGEEYENKTVRTEIEYNAQGAVVGVINPDQVQGGVPDSQTKRDGGVQRVHREVASQFVPTGGNPAVIEGGMPAPLDPVAAKIRDDLARRKRVEGPAAALSGMQVTVNPVQRS